MRFVPVIWDFEWSSKIEQFSLEQQIGPKQHSNTQSSHGSNSIRFVLRFDMSEMCVCVFWVCLHFAFVKKINVSSCYSSLLH